MKRNRLSFREAYLEAKENEFLKREKKALKKAPLGNWVITRAKGVKDLNDMMNRGWEHVSDNASSFAMAVPIYVLRIPREVLEERFHG